MTPSSQAKEASEAILPCPRDQAGLVESQGSVPGHACETCGGLFLRNPAIKTALEAAGIELEKCRSFVPAPIDCPHCRARMKGLVINGVVLDLCDACHAIWLDKGELEKVVSALKDDGSPNLVLSLPRGEDTGFFGGIGEVLGRDLPYDDLEYDFIRVLWKTLGKLILR